MTQNKLISVCINAYNSEKYIAETLKSVCEQTYKNLQIIVIDDASTDSTADVVKSINDTRIELYTLEKNGHISNANNESYRKVRGEYMVHLDSDDIMLPDLIEKSVDFLENNAEYGATFCHPTVIDEIGNSLKGTIFDTIFNTNAKTQADFIRLFFDDSNHLLHSGCTMRKSVIDDIGFHNLSLCYLHDFDYWTRLVLKYPIYVFDDFLIKYRVDTAVGSNNSHMDELKTLAHNNEYARVIYNMIDNCPDKLFLEAFADRLLLQGEHTHEETELEKAFLLKDGLMVLPKNKILSILKLSELLNDKKYVELARDKFGFTIRDFYKLQTSEILHNQAKYDAQKNEYDCKLLQENEKFLTLQNEFNIKQNEFNLKENELNSQLSQANQTISVLNGELNQKNIQLAEVVNLANARQTEIENLNSILNYKQKLLNRTVEYRVAKLLKKCVSLLKRVKHFTSLRDKNGKKYRKSVMLYGFFGMNVGDDLFFEKLITRYPNTMFLVYFSQNYRQFFEKFPNVKFYAYEDTFVQKINRIGAKLKIRDTFEWLLLKRSSATVHIGGSIYQQICDWQTDYKVRIRRKQKFKPFYSISCNFGPHKTDEYIEMWKKQFKKYKDVCFRDKYSYNLFEGVKSVRYAPDLLFSYKADTKVPEISGSVAISVYDPFAPHRETPEQISIDYRDTIVKTVCDLASNGKKVTLLGFCTFEGDGNFIDDVLNRLPENVRGAVDVVNYSFETKDNIINSLLSAEYIIGTRLHSVILGFVFGKKVLPIAYNQKINYILSDIGYDGPIVKIEEINKYKENGFKEILQDLNPFDVSEFTNSDNLQFARLDKFLK